MSISTSIVFQRCEWIWLLKYNIIYIQVIIIIILIICVGLSATVSNALLKGGVEAKETATFVNIFDNFFDS